MEDGLPDTQHRDPVPTPRHQSDRLLWMESISYQEMRRARRRRPVRALRRLAMLFIQLLPLVLLAGFLARLLLEE